MNAGFYGGPNGQSFAVKQVFTSKYQLDQDISKGWTSPVSVGEYVLVSYGMPNDENYDIYKQEDLKYYSKTYNSTLWQKIYQETEGRAANGISYKLLASMTGNTPKLTIEEPITKLKADQDPAIQVDYTDIDNPIFTFMLPRSQNLMLDQPVGTLDCDEDPELFLDDSDPDYPVLYFALPVSQVIEQVELTPLDVGEPASATLDITDINKPILKLSLPQTQTFNQGNTEVVDADQKPHFTIDTSDINNPILSFELPQSQVFAPPQKNVVGPMTDPNVTMNSDNVNSPILTFDLPRAVRFYYGSLLGETKDSPYELTEEAFRDYEVGDYYINAATGFIYQVQNKTTDTTCIFEYVACIQQPLPETVAVGIDPFVQNDDGEWVPADPSIDRMLTNDEGTAWKLTFGIPSAPLVTTDFNFVGVTEHGDVRAAVRNEKTIEFNFDIPRGSQFFPSVDKIEATSIVDENQLPGDLCLEVPSGLIFQLSAEDGWIQWGERGIKGEVGNALNIVRSYTIQETAAFKNSLENGVQYIEDNYVDKNGDPIPYSPEDIFAITWTDNSLAQTTYWYFYTAEKKWSRALLTGGIMGFLVSSYTEDTEEDKSYNVPYINALIGGDIEGKDKDRTTYSASQIDVMFTELMNSFGRFEELLGEKGE